MTLLQMPKVIAMEHALQVIKVVASNHCLVGYFNGRIATVLLLFGNVTFSTANDLARSLTTDVPCRVPPCTIHLEPKSKIVVMIRERVGPLTLEERTELYRQMHEHECI
jgi:hypothetical protein